MPLLVSAWLMNLNNDGRNVTATWGTLVCQSGRCWCVSWGAKSLPSGTFELSAISLLFDWCQVCHSCGLLYYIRLLIRSLNPPLYWTVKSRLQRTRSVSFALKIIRLISQLPFLLITSTGKEIKSFLWLIRANKYRSDLDGLITKPCFKAHVCLKKDCSNCFTLFRSMDAVQRITCSLQGCFYKIEKSLVHAHANKSYLCTLSNVKQWLFHGINTNKRLHNQVIIQHK